MKKISLLLSLVCFVLCTKAQNIFPSTGSTGIGTATPNTSAILEIKSTTKGMLVPRMTKALRDAIAAPATGLLIYQTNSAPGFYYYSGTAWKPVSGVDANTSLSNLKSAAININLLPDTTNLRNLGSASFAWKNIYYTGSLYSGSNRILWTDAAANTFLGITSGNMGVTGSFNTAMGYQTMFLNTTGYYNTAVGGDVLYNNSTGYNNTGSGYYALAQNTIGYNNTATGANALMNNTIGTDNSATGFGALSTNSTGSWSTATGSQSLQNNTTGYYNTANGFQALYLNTTGYFNTANGSLALNYNSTGFDNTANGSGALLYNTTGSENTACGFQSLNFNSTGFENTADGFGALFFNTTGSENTASGTGSLSYNTTGFSNTANGYEALYNNTTGYQNTASGFQSLIGNTTGVAITAFGDYTNVNSGGYFNGSAFGNATIITASNQVRIGSSGVTSIGGYANWTNISDGRVKKNIKQNVPGLSFINKLRPVTYNLDLDAADAIVQRPAVKGKDGKIMQPSANEIEERRQKEQIVYTGFVAQDVEKAAKSLNYDFSGVDAAKNSKDLYGLRYSDFVVPLVKAVQELSKQNDELKDENSLLEQRLAKLEAMMNAQSSTINNKLQTINITDVSIEQNTPNPFSSTTAIHYTLPQKCSTGQIIITDKSGKVLKQINVTGAGKGSLTVDAALLSSGAYNYSLYVDGKLVGSKQMVLTK